MKRLLISLLLACGFVSSSSAQQLVFTPSVPAAQSITISASVSVLAVGGTSMLSAVVNNPGPNNQFNYCPFASSNPAVFTVVGNVATGVGTGTANVTCTWGGLTSNAVAITVSGSPVITNPSSAFCAGVSPCPLPQATNGSAYTFAFSAQDLIPCCTWTVTVGSIPAWASLNSSTGVLSGTPNANATTNFTITATDTGSNVTSLAVSLTVLASPTCSGNFGGPPTYPCASTSTANPGLIAPIFTSSNPKGTVNTTHNVTVGSCTTNCMQWVSGDTFNTSWNTSTGGVNNVLIAGVKVGITTWNSSTVATLNTNIGTLLSASYVNFSACKAGTSPTGTGNGCATSTGFDTTIPGYIAGSGCIARAWDQASIPGGVSPIGTTSQASGQLVTSLHGTYFIVSSNGGKNWLGQTTLVSNCLQTAWDQTTTGTGNITFDHTLDNVFYNSGLGADGTEIDKCTITGGTYPSAPSFNCVAYFDYFLGGGSTGGPPCPGITPFIALSGPGQFGVSSDGHRFGAMWGAHGQGSAYQTFVYDVSLPGCWVSDWSTGKVYGGPSGGFCTSSCGPTTAAFGTMQGTIATTMAAALTSPGTFTIFPASITNIRVGDYLLIDGGGTQQETVLVSTIPLVNGRSPCFSSPCFTATFQNTHLANATIGATSCWGAPGAASTSLNLHEVQTPMGGTWIMSTISPGGNWTQGACVGDANTTQVMISTPGTTTQFFLDGTSAYGWGSHSSMGQVNAISPYFGGPNLRNMGTPDTFTTFFTSAAWTAIADTHAPTWPHYCAGTGTTPNDSCPWFQVSDEVKTTQGSAGTGNCPVGTLATLCPNYLQNVIFAMFPNAVNQTPIVFFHTFACNPATGGGAQCPSGIRDTFGAGNAIGNVSQDGTMIWWVSTMLQSTGVDNTNIPASSVFVGRL